MGNHLAGQTSPYLLQHASNPVDWYPWGDEAFARAQAEDKPVLVSIGYAACHWCHVMERESFEDQATAETMNERFVSIKVDREERPDVDAIYMAALQTITGRGGWPLNVFLLPDGRPFYGGSYYPKTDRPGMPSWSRVLTAISDAYRDRREQVVENAATLTDQLRNVAFASSAKGAVDASLLDRSYEVIASQFDTRTGGFGGAPKFPNTQALEFILRYHLRTQDPTALPIVEHSIQAMARGGIYDHLGGGFSRYATDADWQVPHFEKMLYDNAMIASVCLQAHQVTGRPEYRNIVDETLGYMLRELCHPEGGFYSSQDADSEGVEGKYYVWSVAEIEDILGGDLAAIFRRYYGVTDDGNFEGLNILHVASSASEVAREFHISQVQLARELAKARQVLLEVRSRRVPPATDDKVLTSWNGLALRALAEAGIVLGFSPFVEAAEKDATFLLSAMRPHGRLLRTWKDGVAHLNAYLEDYAFLINGLISLHQATFAHKWLHAAKELTDEMLDLFWDDALACFFDVGRDHDHLILRPRSTFDNTIPSGSSAATEALLRMEKLTGSENYREVASISLSSVAPLLPSYALGVGNWLGIGERHVAPPMELAIISTGDTERTRALQRSTYARYAPHLAIAGVTPEEPTPFSSPILVGRGQVNGLPTAYVCNNYACDLPTTDPVELLAQLSPEALEP